MKKEYGKKNKKLKEGQTCLKKKKGCLRASLELTIAGLAGLTAAYGGLYLLAKGVNYLSENAEEILGFFNK